MSIQARAFWFIPSVSVWVGVPLLLWGMTKKSHSVGIFVLQKFGLPSVQSHQPFESICSAARDESSLGR